MIWLITMLVLVSAHYPQADTAIIHELASVGVQAKKVDRGVAIFLPEVYFGLGEVRVGVEGSIAIRTAVDVLRRNSVRHKHAYFEGHTDSTGEEDYNMELGLQRAEEVMMLFHKEGLSSRRTTAFSYGETLPISSDPKENRRVDILLINRN